MEKPKEIKRRKIRTLHLKAKTEMEKAILELLTISTLYGYKGIHSAIENLERTRSFLALGEEVKEAKAKRLSARSEA